MANPVTSVDQLSKMPTNKVTAFMMGGMAAAWMKFFIVRQFPEAADPALWEPLPFIIGFAVAYFVRDRPNVDLPAPAVPENAANV